MIKTRRCFYQANSKTKLTARSTQKFLIIRSDEIYFVYNWDKIPPREVRTPLNLPHFQSVASQFSQWWCPVNNWEAWVPIPLESDFFQASSLQFLKIAGHLRRSLLNLIRVYQNYATIKHLRCFSNPFIVLHSHVIIKVRKQFTSANTLGDVT